MIGPSIPGHLSSKHSTTPDDDDEIEAGPSAPVIGPAIPQNLPPPQHQPTGGNEQEEEEEEDDYTPALPPDLVAARSSHSTVTPPTNTTKSKAVVGPTFPPRSKQNRHTREEEEDSDDDYGPQPLPAGVVLEENEGVREFLEKEERRRKQIEVGVGRYIHMRFHSPHWSQVFSAWSYSPCHWVVPLALRSSRDAFLLVIVAQRQFCYSWPLRNVTMEAAPPS